VAVLAPRAPVWAVAAAGMVLLLPQFSFNSATAANDSTFNCASAAAFYVWFRCLRDPAYDPWLLRASGILGLALLAKLTALALAPGLGLVLLFRLLAARAGLGGGRAWGRYSMRLVGGAATVLLAVSGWLFVRNFL